MHVVDDCIAALTQCHPFINEVVHLLLQPFTKDTKNAALSWSRKVDGSWLKRVMWVVDLRDNDTRAKEKKHKIRGGN